MPGKEILRASYAGIRLQRDPAQEVQRASAPPAPQLIPDQITGQAGDAEILFLSGAFITACGFVIPLL
jgi:hypothetical protein